MTIRYFVPKSVNNTGKTVDENNIELGAYLEISGEVKKINLEMRRIQISDESLSIDDVVNIQEVPLTGTSEQTINIFGEDCV